MKNSSPDNPPAGSWDQTLALGKKTLDALIARLPEELRGAALKLGYILRDLSPADEDLLGDYDEWSESITLYLEAIRRHCADESLDFATEVETTYLHELGHHLGLDEDDLEQRGLE